MDAKPKREQPASPPPPWVDVQPTSTEQWYLDCLRAWCQAMGRAPKIHELAAWIARTKMPTWTALANLEAKGLVTRTAARRFIPAEFAGVIR